MKALFTILSLCFFQQTIFAQNDSLNLFSIQGKVTDLETKETLMFATVALYKNGSETPLTGLETDLDGNYKIEVEAGVYDIEVSYAGYGAVRVNAIRVDKLVTKNVALKSGIEDVPVCGLPGHVEPLIRFDNTTSGRRISGKDISRMPIK